MKQRLSSILKRTNNFIEENQGMKFGAHFFRFIAIIVLIGTGIQIMLDLSDREREIVVREAAHKHVLRESLLTPVSGSTGKGEALQELMMVSEGAEFSGLDLSCERMNGGWDENTLICENPVILDGVDFSKVYQASIERAAKAQLAAGVAEYGIVLNRLNFTGVSAQFQNWSHLSVEDGKLAAADFSNSVLSTVALIGDLRGFKCEFCDLSYSLFQDDFHDVSFAYSNLTGTAFVGPLDGLTLDDTWAWADQIPLAQVVNGKNSENGYEGELVIDPNQQKRLFEMIRLCDPATREDTQESLQYEGDDRLSQGEFVVECEEIAAEEALKTYADENSFLIQSLNEKSDHSS